jgi:hypothetical protein
VQCVRIHHPLGDGRQLLVGLAFLVERLLQQPGDFVVPEQSQRGVLSGRQ